MDPRRRRLSFLLLFFITAAILFPNLSSASSRESVKNSEKSKVTLAIYYESLCPYCSNFIVNDLVELFESGLISDVDLKLIPYGNARIGPNDTLTCQVLLNFYGCFTIVFLISNYTKSAFYLKGSHMIRGFT
ncbi:hypothetical protein CsSME_00041195 [Camellia sinensis var. sinensis]